MVQIFKFKMSDAAKETSAQSAESSALAVNPRVSLLTLYTVRALRGTNTEAVKRDVESGKYLWVFDFSISKNAPDSRSAALRFWFIELLQQPGVRDLSLENVVGQILPTTRDTYTAQELSVKFSTNEVTLRQISLFHRSNVKKCIGRSNETIKIRNSALFKRLLHQ